MLYFMAASDKLINSINIVFKIYITRHMQCNLNKTKRFVLWFKMEMHPLKYIYIYLNNFLEIHRIFKIIQMCVCVCARV